MPYKQYTQSPVLIIKAQCRDPNNHTCTILSCMHFQQLTSQIDHSIHNSYFALETCCMRCMHQGVISPVPVLDAGVFFRCWCSPMPPSFAQQLLHSVTPGHGEWCLAAAPRIHIRFGRQWKADSGLLITVCSIVERCVASLMIRSVDPLWREFYHDVQLCEVASPCCRVHIQLPPKPVEPDSTNAAQLTSAACCDFRASCFFMASLAFSIPSRSISEPCNQTLSHSLELQQPTVTAHSSVNSRTIFVTGSSLYPLRCISTCSAHSLVRPNLTATFSVNSWRVPFNRASWSNLPSGPFMLSGIVSASACFVRPTSSQSFHQHCQCSTGYQCFDAGEIVVEFLLSG